MKKHGFRSQHEQHRSYHRVAHIAIGAADHEFLGRVPGRRCAMAILYEQPDRPGSQGQAKPCRGQAKPEKKMPGIGRFMREMCMAAGKKNGGRHNNKHGAGQDQYQFQQSPEYDNEVDGRFFSRRNYYQWGWLPIL